MPGLRDLQDRSLVAKLGANNGQDYRMAGLQDLQDKQNETLSTVLYNLDRIAGWFYWD